MSHDRHDLPRWVLGDDCEECVSRAGTLDGLEYLDQGNLDRLGELALEVHRYGKPPDASYADMKAVQTLRRAARLTFAAGITEEVAR